MGRGENPLGWVVPPHQRLRAYDLSGLDIIFRLIVRLKFPFGQSAVHLIFNLLLVLLAVLHGLKIAVIGVVELIMSLALLFGPAAGEIRAVQYLAEGKRLCLAVPENNTHTGGYWKILRGFPSALWFYLRNIFYNPLCSHLRFFLCLNVRKQHGKFLAADARSHPAVSFGNFPQPFTNLCQHLVADKIVIPVIDAFKLIHIHKKQSHSSAARLDGLLDIEIKGFSVIKSGQAVLPAFFQQRGILIFKVLHHGVKALGKLLKLLRSAGN